MNKNKYSLKKQGNVYVVIGIVVLVIIFMATFLVYYQVNIITESIRHDLFYASNASLLSFDTQDLAYKKYTVDENKTKQVIEYLLNRNYTEGEGNIINIKVTNLKVNYEQDKVILETQIQVTFRSVINLLGENKHSFKMNENIKIALLEYN